jgi:precorrin-2/cobalt-factor-2 C20-methyltransferase
MTGRLVGVGVGPGDPELLTLKAVRALAEADVVAHFAKKGNSSNARKIVELHLRGGIEELPLLYPVTTEAPSTEAFYRDAIGRFYDQSAAAIARRLDAGRVVAVISEGDPLFYGSYMHLHVRLSKLYPTEIVAGVTGMSERRFADTDAAVVMKIGRHLPKVRRALDRAGCLKRAVYVERGTTANAITMPLTSKLDDVAPYFSIILLPGWETGS